MFKRITKNKCELTPRKFTMHMTYSRNTSDSVFKQCDPKTAQICLISEHQTADLWRSYAVMELVFCVYLFAHSVVTWCGKIDHYVGGSNQRTVNESRNWDCIVQILVLLSLLWKARKQFVIMKKRITIETKTIVQWVSCLRMLHKKNFQASVYKVRFYNEFIRWRKQEIKDKVCYRKGWTLTSVRWAHDSDWVLSLKLSSLDCWSSCSEVWQNKGQQ